MGKIITRLFKSFMTTRKTCRVCEGKLKTLFSLGNLCVSTFVKELKKCVKAPLEMTQCQNKDCGLLQLKHTADYDLMYSKHYWYRSGLNKVITDDLKTVVRDIKKRKGVWIDVGANDGALLSFVRGFKRIGIEPATNLTKELKKHCEKVFVKFWEDVKTDKADVITAIGMFYDSENPNSFISNVKNHLKDDGVFIAQLMTAKQMVKMNDIGNICAEHLEYYDYKSLVYLYEKNGLEIYKVEENKINGGSYRLYARHYKKGSVKRKEPKVDWEKFIQRMKKNKANAMKFIKGKNVCIYGASTKGNTIAQYYGMNSKNIVCAIDKSKEKWGKYMVGTNIPILPEENLSMFKYAFVMPYGFINLFKEREKKWLAQGGKFLMPFPEFKQI